MSFAITILRRTLYFMSVIAATYTDELVRGGEQGTTHRHGGRQTGSSSPQGWGFVHSGVSRSGHGEPGIDDRRRYRQSEGSYRAVSRGVSAARGKSVNEPPAGGPRAAPLVGIVMGSDSDLEVMRPAYEILAELGVPAEVRVLSAHRTPEDALEYGRSAAERGLRAIIAGAGGAAHLAGVLAAVTTLPVIGVPVPTAQLGGLDSLLSMVPISSGVALGRYRAAPGADRRWASRCLPRPGAVAPLGVGQPVCFKFARGTQRRRTHPWAGGSLTDTLGVVSLTQPTRETCPPR